MTNNGLLLVTKAFDYKTFTIDDAFANSTENKIILEFYIDKPAIPTRHVFDLDQNKNFIEPGRSVIQAEAAIERNVQFSLAMNLENAISLKETIIDAIEKFEKVKNEAIENSAL